MRIGIRDYGGILIFPVFIGVYPSPVGSNPDHAGRIFHYGVNNIMQKPSAAAFLPRGLHMYQVSVQGVHNHESAAPGADPEPPPGIIKNSVDLFFRKRISVKSPCGYMEVRDAPCPGTNPNMLRVFRILIQRHNIRRRKRRRIVRIMPVHTKIIRIRMIQTQPVLGSDPQLPLEIQHYIANYRMCKGPARIRKGRISYESA